MLSIGTCTLGTVPRAVAIVDTPIDTEVLRAQCDHGAALIEFRADLVMEALGGEQADLDAVCACAEQAASLDIPLIGTVRENVHTRGERVRWFRRLAPFVAAFDIEVDAPDREVLREAAAGKTIIISEHDYETTPSLSRLQEIVAVAVAAGADIVKLAVTAQAPGDVTRLLGLAAMVEVPLVLIAMGPVGMISRIAAPLYGSLFTFGYIGKKIVAPGQLSLEELCGELRRYYPGF